MQVSTGQLVARGEERIGSTTTMPMSLFIIEGKSRYDTRARFTDTGIARKGELNE